MVLFEEYKPVFSAMADYLCSFEKNGTAISFKQLPFTDNFIFTETKFIGNDTDIINYTDCTLDLSGDTFK